MVEVKMTPLLMMNMKRTKIMKMMELHFLHQWSVQTCMRTYKFLLIELILVFGWPNWVCSSIPWSCHLPSTKHRGTFNIRLCLHLRVLLWSWLLTVCLIMVVWLIHHLSKVHRLFFEWLHIQLPLTMITSLSPPHLPSDKWVIPFTGDIIPTSSKNHKSCELPCPPVPMKAPFMIHGIDQCWVKVLKYPSPWYLLPQFYSNIWSSIHCPLRGATNCYSAFSASCASRLHYIIHALMGCYEIKKIQVTFFLPRLQGPSLLTMTLQWHKSACMST